jgi:hypothetical protein
MVWTNDRWTKIIGLRLDMLKQMGFYIGDEAKDLLPQETLTVALECLDEVFPRPERNVTRFIIKFLDKQD